MCGIVAVTGYKKALPLLINGLEKLEYRGYDSAGVAIINSETNFISCNKAKGKLKNLISNLNDHNIPGTVGIGHTRMATESAITTDGSHPYSTGSDECLVHNGSLSNHNNLRRNLTKKGINFKSENDTEVAAGYISNHLSSKKNLKETLMSGLDDLDGFYTFITGTRKGFAIVRDEIACKPAVVAETKDYVAIASEFQAMAHLPGVNMAKIFEPEPGVVYSWGN